MYLIISIYMGRYNSKDTLQRSTADMILNIQSIPVHVHQCRSQKGRLRAQAGHCLGPATCSDQQCSKPTSSQPISVTITLRYSSTYTHHTPLQLHVKQTACVHVLFMLLFLNNMHNSVNHYFYEECINIYIFYFFLINRT